MMMKIMNNFYFMRILTFILCLLSVNAFAEVTPGDLAFIPADFAYTKVMAEKVKLITNAVLGCITLVALESQKI